MDNKDLKEDSILEERAKYIRSEGKSYTWEEVKENATNKSNRKELTIDEFKSWIEEAENKPTISLQEAMEKWTNKRIELQKSI